MNNKIKNRLYFWLISIFGDIGIVLMMIGFTLRYNTIICFLVFITIGLLWGYIATRIGARKGL